jgi:MYXO-CTERM domain-containing protein
VSIYTGGEAISRFTASAVSSGTDIIALSVADPTLGVFAVLEAGNIGGGGSTWSARRMALPCYDNWDPNLVTADGWKLLDGAVDYAVAPIPEPSAWAMALGGLSMAAALIRRRLR